MAKIVSEITQAVRDSRRWTAEQAASVLAAAEGSGLSQRAFAKRHGLHPQRLTRWRQQLGRARMTDRRFVELTAVPVVRACASGFEVALRNGRVVRVGVGFDAGELGRLLAVVEEGPC